MDSREHWEKSGLLCTFEKYLEDSLRERTLDNKNLRAKAARLEKALQQVADWKMPECNKTWDDGSPMSYSAAFGSSGERDYIRGIAKTALEGGDE